VYLSFSSPAALAAPLAALLLLLTLALFLLSLALGEFVLLPGSRWDLELRILLELRLPRALLALLAGASSPAVAPCCR
jgi:ABC-type Fe3+-siderophore transport system permease subunit